MALDFPNVCRSYDTRKHSVHFWGYDGVFEILFQVNFDALCAIAPGTANNETDILESFDSNWSRIIHAAAKAYSRDHKDCYSLTESDF